MRVEHCMDGPLHCEVLQHCPHVANVVQATYSNSCSEPWDSQVTDMKKFILTKIN